MALTVDFWTFAKRENTTLLPFTNPLKTYTTVQLKDDCSVVNPALKIRESINTRVMDWNYCYIHEFNRYYFVTDWIWNNGIWISELQVDVLSSFRTEIGNQTLYILRAYQNSDGTNLFNGNIIDTTYPCTAEQATYQSSAVDNPFGLESGAYFEGTYIIGIINKNSKQGSVTYYAFNSLGFKEFCGKLFTYSTGWLNINVSEISEDLQKALINPFQYIVSCQYIPVPVNWFTSNSIGTYTNTVYFGWWDVSVVFGCREIPWYTNYSQTIQLTIPRHPQASTRGNYLNVSPYSFYTLRFYPFGTIDIDSEAIAGWSTLDLYINLDVCTGNGILNICVNGKNNPIRTIEAQISVNIPTASIQVDYANLGTSKTAIAAGAALVSSVTSGNGGWFQNLKENAKNFVANVRAGGLSSVAGSAKEVFSNIASSALAAKATAEITGQQGTFSQFEYQTLTLSGRFLPVADEDYTHRGRPLCQNKQINTMKGFIVCADADIAIPCTDREKSAIQAYLEGGFYYY